MADANLTIGLTHEAANSIATIVAAKALGHWKANAVLARLVARDWENAVAEFGKTVNVTKRGALSVNDKAEHGKITLQQPADSAYAITLNKHKEVSFAIEDPARAFATPDLLDGYMEDAVKVLAEQVDSDIAALYSGLSQTVDATGAAGPIAAEDFIEARRLLNAAKAPLSDRFAVLHEDAESEYLAVEEAINLSYAQSLGGALANAYTGRFVGFQTFLDQKINVAAAVCENLFFHKYAMCLATRPLPLAEAGWGAVQKVMSEDGVGLRVTLSYDTDLLAVKCTLDVLYGVGELEDAFGVVVKTTEK